MDEATIDAILSWKEKRKGPESSASPPGPPTDVGAFKDPPALSLRFKQYSDLFKDAYNATLAAINSKAASQDAPYRELQEFATLLDEDLRGVMTAIERLAESEAPENSGAVLRKFKNDLVILQVLASRLQAPPTDSPDVLIHDTLAVRDFIRRRRAAYAKDERAWRASRGDASEGSD